MPQDMHLVTFDHK